MTTYNYSYNVLINRLEAFAAGHYLIKRFTHGQIDLADMNQDEQYPFMHVVPNNIRPVDGGLQFDFQIMFADIPRDKEYKAEYQREVISDCVRLAQDLIAEVKNGIVLFGFDVQLVQPPTIEPFQEEYKNTLTGVTFSLQLEVPWDWSACEIPATWAVGGVSTGGNGTGLTGLVLKVNNVDNIVQTMLNLVEGSNVSIVDNGDGSVTIASTGGASWGDITGDLADQIDLIAALNLKADITSLGAVAFSNDYNDLDNLPTIPTLTSELTNDSGFITIGDVPPVPTLTSELTNDSGFITIGDVPTQVQSNWTQSDNGQLDFIKNKPTLATVATSGSYNDLSNQPTIPANLDDLGDVNASTPTNAQVLTYNTATSKWIASTPASGSGTVTSVALTAPAAFSVTGSPITASGTLGISAAGTSAQYVRGDGQLATTPTALPPNGTASGDLQNTYPSPTVHRVHGVDMQSGTPTADDTWVYGGSPAKWQHQKLHSNQVTNDSTVTGANVDNALSALDSGKQAILVSGTNIKTINSTTLLGSGNITTGTVTSVAALTLVTTGTDLSSSVATGSTTPVITLNVPTASATNRGALSAADWSTFNGKQDAIGLTTAGTALATLPNPSAISYLRINANNTVSALTLAQLKTDLSISSNITVVLGSNVTNVAALTVEDITGLSFAVLANKTYRFRVTLLTSRTSGGSTASFTINGPTFSTNGMAFRFTQTGTASTTTSNGQNSYNGITNSTIASGAIVNGDGIVRTTAAGTIQIRMYAAAAAMLTIQAGSFIEYSEIA